jgi:integrase/recombinase XerD
MPGRKWTDIGDPNDASGMVALCARFLQSMGVANYSKQTAQTREKHLRPFFHWCNERGIGKPTEVTRQHVERYQVWLYQYRKDSGEPLDSKTQSGMLVSLRMFFRWLTRQSLIPYNPTSELELPKVGQRLPKTVLTPEEVEQVLLLPDVGEPLGLRDRAILETLYSTGVRRLELAHLRLHDLDTTKGVIYVRKGKGDKDRVVPIGERALAWVGKYIEQSRPKLLVDVSETTVFVTRLGEPFGANALTYLAGSYIEKANLGKLGACHAFRHSMATAMLENGADIRFIQEILGHAKVTSTEVYTHVAIGKLKAVHDATHPAAKLTKPKADAPATEVSLPEVDPRAALLEALEHEAAEEDSEDGDG